MPSSISPWKCVLWSRCDKCLSCACCYGSLCPTSQLLLILLWPDCGSVFHPLWPPLLLQVQKSFLPGLSLPQLSLCLYFLCLLNGGTAKLCVHPFIKCLGQWVTIRAGSCGELSPWWETVNNWTPVTLGWKGKIRRLTLGIKWKISAKDLPRQGKIQYWQAGTCSPGEETFSLGIVG